MNTLHKYSDLTLYRRLLAEARPFWWRIATLFGVNLLATPIALLNPLPLKIVIDNVLGTKPLPHWVISIATSSISKSTEGMLLFAAGLVLVIALITYLQGLITWVLTAYTGEKLVLGFRAKLFRHVQNLCFTYHDTKGTLDSVYRIQYDTVAIQTIAMSIISFISAGMTVIGMVWITWIIDAYLALIAVTIVPILFFLSRASRQILRPSWSVLKNNESSAMSIIHETLSALRTVKTFGKEDRENERFTDKSSQVVREQVRLACIEGGFDLLIGLTLALGTAAVLVVGVHHVLQQIISLGELILIMGYLAQIYRPLETVVKKIAELQSALASAERALTVLDEKPKIKDPENGKSVMKALGLFEFRGVYFGYEKDNMVLKDISFTIPAGTHVGIMGKTGAGKTTLLSLILRFYDPTKGSIFLDGTDLRDYKLVDLRNQFAMVLQESILFSTSIAENIAYSRPDASEKEIIEAAKAANAHDFICSQPQGYNTIVGERGQSLSGGERQRISLARAFLKDAPILILDEPTSSVDVKTEQQIMEAMDRLTKGRTTFIIAHRLATLRNCDMCLKFENGRLVQIPVPNETSEHQGLVSI
jgi:ATP-binding cassette, subfamily B, bacterial